MLNRIYQNVVFKGMDLIRGRRNIERLKFLRKSQYWPSDKLEKWQLERLNLLLKTAKENSSFYAERLRNINLPLKDLSEIQTISILTKSDIRTNMEKIKCKNAPDDLFILGKTGGSTGEPMHYYYDKRGRDWNRGCVYRSQEWAETYLGERSVQMTGSHYDFTEFTKLKWKLIFWLQRYKSMPVSVVNDEIFGKYYQELIKYRPNSIWGYASGIYYFAKFVKERHKDANFEFLKAIITSSETLYDHQRTIINEVFGVNKVFDHYGSREFYIASECKEHKGYHLHAEVVLVEVVDNEGEHKKQGELGRILVTDLSNLVFPFIRYEIGDVGIFSEEIVCPCGVSLPKLAKIEGRIADVIVLPDRILTPPNFTILLSDHKGIEQYQILQKTRNTLILNIVRNNEYREDSERYLRKGLADLAGAGVNVKIEYVNKIDTPASGKRRYVISEISKEIL